MQTPAFDLMTFDSQIHHKPSWPAKCHKSKKSQVTSAKSGDFGPKPFHRDHAMLAKTCYLPTFDTPEAPSTVLACKASMVSKPKVSISKVW